MPLLPYDARNFPASAPAELHGAGNLAVTWQDLVWAAVTVGKPSALHLFLHGWHSISDLLVRAHTVYASLRETNHRLARSSLYESSDPTEKGATSYFLGMALAKLACSRLLGTPFLFHLSMANSIGLPVRVRGRLEPDLLGQLPNGRWIVVEAKGRTNGFDAIALKKAKRQTRAIRTINGARPDARIAAQTYFDPTMRLILDDPKSRDENSIDIDVDVQAMYHRYYSFIYEATTGSNDLRSIRAESYVFRKIPEAGIEIGVNVNVRSLIDKDSILQADFAGKLAQVHSEAVQGAVSTFPDGLAIILDERWDPKVMSREPTERSGGQSAR